MKTYKIITCTKTWITNGDRNEAVTESCEKEAIGTIRGKPLCKQHFDDLVWLLTRNKVEAEIKLYTTVGEKKRNGETKF